MPLDLKQNWHGAPVWVWAGGGALVGGVGWYVYKTRKNKAASSSNITYPVSDGSSNADNGFPFGGGGSVVGGGTGTGAGGPLGDLGDILGNFLPPTPEPTPPATVAAAVDQIIRTVTPPPVATPAIPVSAANTPVAAPQAAPPQTQGLVPDNWQSIASVPAAPPGYTATPILVGGSIVGENLWNQNEQPQVTAPWQQDLGLAPALTNEGAATPIIVQGQTIGESFTGNPANEPPQLFGTPTQPVAFHSIYGDVTEAQWYLLPPSARL